MRPAVLFRPLRAYAHQVRHATSLRMPAMSPTMTEGGITGWKKAEGESFAAGDVLLEVVSGVINARVIVHGVTCRRGRAPGAAPMPSPTGDWRPG